MQSIIAWKDIRVAVCFVVAFAACGYEPPDTNGSTAGAGGFGGEPANSSSSSSGKGGATSQASSSSGKGGDAVSSSSGNISSSSSAGPSSSSSSSAGPSSSSSSSGASGGGTVACGAGTECMAIPDTHGCCVFGSPAPYCSNPAQCPMSPTFYCDGREDCGGAWCCLEGNTKAICTGVCNTAYLCIDDDDCPPTEPTCKPNVFGPIGKCALLP